jgi:uncharacterized protein YbjT (DUF2867 family)
MHILVFGATGGIGAQCASLGRARGHTIRAFARSAGKLEPGEGLEPWAGDATDPADVEAALDGVDAVIQALGIKESLKMVYEEVTLFSEATRALLPAMERTGVRRLLSVTGFGAGESRSAVSWLEAIPFRVVLGKPYEDKDRQEAMIRESPLDWTLVRPTILTNGRATGRYRVLSRPEEWSNGMISRADVADFLIREAEAGEHIRQGVVLKR